MEEIKITLYGRPITKKNSSQIIFDRKNNRPMLIQSKQYRHYEKDCLKQISGRHKLELDRPCNVGVLYYMPTKHRVDLVNLLEGTCDILVAAKVLKDDNSKIIVSHDGSRVLYDKENPRAVITIRLEKGKGYEPEDND